MNQFIKSTICCVLVFVFFSFSACNDNLTLDAFDLGNGRRIRVRTARHKDFLTINYELYINASLIEESYLRNADPNKFRKYKFEMLGDKTNNIFVLMQTAPEQETLALLDFSTGFKYPGCVGVKGWSDCKAEYNRLVDVLEQDNPGWKLYKYSIK
jgi:hypothetical protein